MRWGENLLEKENVRNRNRRKTLFEEDLDISSEDNSADNFKRDSKNDSLSIEDTEEDADKITTEDVKIYDI